jgi:predicted MFS family arabinose efflux permease
MRLPSGFRALSHRDFRLFWTGQLISLIGTWMQSVGQSWLIVELTNSPFKLGLIGALQFTPMLLLSLHAGALADRLPKRKLLVGTQTTLMLLAFALSALVWTGKVQFWHVAVLATLLGTVSTLDVPLRQSFVVEMVGKEDLGNAIALNSAIFNGGRLLGPAVAGILVAKYGVATAFLLNGVSFIAVIMALLGIRAEGLPRPRKERSLAADIREGVSFVRRTPTVLLLLSVLMVVSLFVINYGVLVPVLAKDGLQMEAQGFGLLMSALGAGALAGSLLIAFAGRRQPPSGLVLGAALALCAATAAVWGARSIYGAVSLLFVIGFAQILFTANCNTAIQMTTPDELRGRVMSLYALVFAGVVPAGAFLTGSVTEAFGPWVGYLVDGGLGLLGTVVLLSWWRFVRPRRRTHERREPRSC